jgi:RNA polymerase sigma factor (sigma-70 family)
LYKHWRRDELRLAEFKQDVTEKDHLTGEELQELAEAFVGFYHTEEKEQAWEIGNKLYWHFEPLIKDLLFGRKNKMNVEKSVWTSTIEREGAEDMLSEGKVQFFELLAKYDPSSGVQFGVYIKRKLEFGIFNYLRNGSSFDNAMKATESFELFMEEDFDENNHSYSKAQFYKLIREGKSVEDELFEEVKMSNLNLALRVAWNGLNDRQRKVLDMIINREYTLREAGAELGVHHTTVREIKNTALEKMKKIIKKSMKNPKKPLQ